MSVVSGGVDKIEIPLPQPIRTRHARPRKWKAVFGRPVPSATALTAAAESESFHNTEEFIEDSSPVDVRYGMRIDCKVTQDGFQPTWLRKMLTDRVPRRARKSLDFTIAECEVREPYVVKWKVVNRRPEAERRDNIRGQIINPSAGTGRREGTSFRNDHLVECYVVKDGVVLARNRIRVPIAPG